MIGKQFDFAALLCEVALHDIFSNCGEANREKFGRRRFLCAIHSSDAEMAETAFRSMPVQAQNDILTSYLMFKVSLLNWDHQLGRRSIEQVARCAAHGKNEDVLYACVREAQQTGDKICTLTALKAVAEDWRTGGGAMASLPSVLRCIVRLTCLVEDQAGEHGKTACSVTEDLCHTSEQGLSLSCPTPW